ncbi:mitotic spindle assembly checkpoint protein MAD1-like [Diadema antillarum]|uniref:mitotic spindle assembly checkpoint protein MAD1-like n=1 Tax=Diadema antillarum TaxID=105358 RepID=UPI003A83D68F
MESPGDNTMVVRMMGEFESFIAKDIEKRKRDQHTRERQGDLLSARSRIANLEMEMEMMKTSSKRARLEADKGEEKLKKQLQEKMDTVEELQRQLEFIVNQEKRMKRELEEERSTKAGMRRQYDEQIQELREQKLKLETLMQDFQISSRNSISKLTNDINRKDSEMKLLRVDLENADAQLRYHMKRGIDASSQRRAMEEYKSELVAAQYKIKMLEQQIRDQEDGAVVARAVQANAQKVTKLEQEISRLKHENAFYRETVENNALLKEKVTGLEAKLARASERCTEFARLQVENEDLKARLHRWETISGDQPSRPKSPSEMVQQITDLQRGQVSLLEQQGQYMASAHANEEAYKATSEKLVSISQDLLKEKEHNRQQDDLVKRLQRRLLMLTKERDGMRQILNSYDTEVTHSGFELQANARLKQAEENAQACHRQLEQLDETVKQANAEAGQYRLQVQQLQLELRHVREELTSAQAAIGKKDALSGVIPSDEVEELRGKVAALEERCKTLAERNESLELHMERSALKGDYDPTKTKILSFSMNPAAVAKKQKGEELEKLRAECETLRQRVRVLEESGDRGDTEVIANKIKEEQTRAVQDVKKELELSELRNQRLKEVFSQKIQEFRQACYRLTGYRIDNPTNNQYKLLSMYAETPNDILHFQMTPTGEMNLLENDFSSTLTDMVEEFLLRGDSIPAFLSSVTLDLFNRQTVMR